MGRKIKASELTEDDLEQIAAFVRRCKDENGNRLLEDDEIYTLGKDDELIRAKPYKGAE